MGELAHGWNLAVVLLETAEGPLRLFLDHALI